MIGRPSSYTDAKAELICERIASGETLVAVCRDADMPTERTVYNWLDKNENFFRDYERARERQAERWAAEIVELADSVLGERDSSPAVHAARLAVDARKWVVSRLLPKKYGDRVGVESSGNITVRVVQGLGDDV